MVWALLAVAIYDGLCASKPSEDIGELKRSDWSPCGSVRSLLWLVSVTSGGVGSRKPASEQQRPPCLHAPSCRPTPHDPMPLPPTPLLPRPFLTHLEHLHKEAMCRLLISLCFLSVHFMLLSVEHLRHIVQDKMLYLNSFLNVCLKRWE